MRLLFAGYVLGACLAGAVELEEEVSAGDDAVVMQAASPQKLPKCPKLSKPQILLMGPYAKYQLCDAAIMKSSKEALVEPFLGMKMDSIDLIIGNQALMRKFDFFEKRWKRVKRENVDLKDSYAKLTEATVKAKRDLREEVLDYGALTIALKQEYHDLRDRAAAFDKFQMKHRSFLTAEQVALEAKEANADLKPQKEREAAIVDKAAQGAKTKKKAPPSTRKLLALGENPEIARVYPYTKLPRPLSFNGDLSPPGNMSVEYRERVTNDTATQATLEKIAVKRQAKFSSVIAGAKKKLADAENVFTSTAAKKAAAVKADASKAIKMAREAKEAAKKSPGE
jgi:hypothetical protein